MIAVPRLTTSQKMRVRTVIFDEELSPAQGRNVQDVINDACDGDYKVQVLDRTQLILVIFAQRARTGEAKLQVAAAQMKYMLPRLTTFLTQGAGMDAKGGSGGAFARLGGNCARGAPTTPYRILLRWPRCASARAQRHPRG